MWGLGIALAGLLSILLVVGVAMVVAYPNLPDISDLADYKPKLPLRIYTADGQLMGEFGEERRNLTPIKDIPDVMKNAVLSIEDNRFYQHGGVDYLGIFDDVAAALEFDDQSVKQVVSNIEELKDKLPEAMQKCLAFFNGCDRTLQGYEGLIAAQQCLPNNEVRDNFAAEYTVLARIWEALSPDSVLSPFEKDYKWLSQVYQSVQPSSGHGKLIWHSLGAKTIVMVIHQGGFQNGTAVLNGCAGNLDPATSVGIMKLLDRINRTGTTVVMATHDRGIVDTMRRRVIEIDRGSIVRDQARGVYE